MKRKYLDKKLEGVKLDISTDKHQYVNQLIDAYNILVDAVNELQGAVEAHQQFVVQIETNIKTINNAFKRIGVEDRINTPHEIGITVANFIWNKQCLSNISPVQTVGNGGQIKKEII